MGFTAACEDDLLDGEMTALEVDGVEVLLAKSGGVVRAFHGICPHQYVPLVEGTFEGGVITCRGHLWQFDGCTGAGINPRGQCLQPYPLRIVDGVIEVDVGAAEASAHRSLR